MEAISTPAMIPFHQASRSDEQKGGLLDQPAEVQKNKPPHPERETSSSKDMGNLAPAHSREENKTTAHPQPASKPGVANSVNSGYLPRKPPTNDPK
ncbi:hypothetical protein Nepgr_033620 [Nepenthes gracilis]|uniref:Uncharacterized protein n=1 Tax=Nepenthes gracilis TaxID=150966 RepID=A0AAD3TMA9_NEPGR|nr:hypothetical protein Nepgr_033620 [Nepenthes gracilis]